MSPPFNSTARCAGGSCRPRLTHYCAAGGKTARSPGDSRHVLLWSNCCRSDSPRLTLRRLRSRRRRRAPRGILHGVRAPLRELLVVLRLADGIGIAADVHVRAMAPLDSRSHAIQNRGRFRPQLRRVRLEGHPLQHFLPDHRRRWGRRRRHHGRRRRGGRRRGGAACTGGGVGAGDSPPNFIENIRVSTRGRRGTCDSMN